MQAEESIEVEQPALALISRAADGSLRDALSLLDQAIAFCGGDVREMPVSEMLGTIDRQHVSRLVSLLADGDPVGMMSVLPRLMNISQTMRDCWMILRECSNALPFSK